MNSCPEAAVREPLLDRLLQASSGCARPLAADAVVWAAASRMWRLPRAGSFEPLPLPQRVRARPPLLPLTCSSPSLKPQITSIEEADKKMEELASSGKIDPAFLQVRRRVGAPSS